MTQTAPATDATVANNRAGIGRALLAVACFSVAPIFVLAANPPFSAIEIAFWRLAIGAIFVGLLGIVTHTPMRLAPSAWRRFIGYGLALAAHLSCYVAALSFTTIAHAVALTYTSPVIIAILSAIFLHERPVLGTVIGLLVAVAGVAVLSGFQPNEAQCTIATGHCMILGDGLAVLAALFASLYTLAGRIESQRYPLFAYTFAVYGFAALWLLPLAAVLATRHGYSPAAIGAVVALGVVPLGMGHTLYNAALRRANPTLVNLIATQEITGGIILGAIVYHQIPSLASLAGVIITLAGIVVVMIFPPTPAPLGAGHLSTREDVS
jgi:drug/metabolite transporter (DMT)-like permease